MAIDLSSLTDEQLDALTEEISGGTAEADVGDADAVVQFPLGFDTRLACVLMGRLKVYGQDVTACGVDALEDHTSDDVVAVQTARLTRRRKWYRSPADGPPSFTLYSELEWVTETTVSPSGIRVKLTTGGGDITLADCVPETTGSEPPANWDGYDQEGFIFDSEDLEPLLEDVDVITGSAMASAAVSGEVLLSEGTWGPLKRFGRRWGLSGLAVDLQALCTSGGCRRFELELQAVGHLLPFNLALEITTTSPGESPSSAADEHSFTPSGWTWLLDSGYPAYKATALYHGRVLPVI